MRPRMRWRSLWPAASGRFLMRSPPCANDLSPPDALLAALATPGPLMTSEQMEFDGSLMVQRRTARSFVSVCVGVVERKQEHRKAPLRTYAAIAIWNILEWKFRNGFNANGTFQNK
ncbi:hypothetical protein Trydic_g22400 [Trypoxylus dichotomus]